MSPEGGRLWASIRPLAEAAAVGALAVGVAIGPLFLGGTWVWARLAIEAAMATARNVCTNHVISLRIVLKHMGCSGNKVNC